MSFTLGGWAVITCPCGVVYSVKFNIRAESPRDYADLLLSWKHVPNVAVYDFPRGLASHANHRSKNLFNPFEGRLLEPSEENIKKASENDLKVSLPWLNHRKEPAHQDGHPVTGSCEHFVLSDVFHQNNSKDPRDSLRKIGLVPELAGKINSQRAEQLFSDMKKKNYFLNMMKPSSHIFLARNILHHKNVARNNTVVKQLRKCIDDDTELQFDCNGKIILGKVLSLCVCMNICVCVCVYRYVNKCVCMRFCVLGAAVNPQSSNTVDIAACSQISGMKVQLLLLEDQSYLIKKYYIFTCICIFIRVRMFVFVF